MRILMNASAALGSLFALVLIAAPASAAVTATSSTTGAAADAAAIVPLADVAAECYDAVVSPDNGALVCFNPTGEHLYVCDNDEDGHHPGTWYRINSGAWHWRHYDLGYLNCHDINLDTDESSTVTYQACNYEGSTELSCSGYVTVSARG